MHEEHRWTIKDLIRHMVTEAPEKKYAVSAQQRAKNLSAAIFQQPVVIEALSLATTHIQDLQTSNVANVLQKELYQLQKQVPEFSRFSIEGDPKDLDFPNLVERVKEIAPGLWLFLKSIVGLLPTGDRESARNCDGAFLMICATLAHNNAPIKSSAFHTLLGIHLHSMGVKRRTINLLAGLGITVNYRTVINKQNDLASIGAVLSLSPGSSKLSHAKFDIGTVEKTRPDSPA